MRSRSRRRTRAPRGQGDRLREEIIEATERLLLETGDVDAVSVRAIAEAVGVTPPSIYLHFVDRNELIFEVCDRRFRALEDLARQAAAGVDDPMSALRAMGRAYVRFGLEHPEEYRVLFMARAPEDLATYMRDRLADPAALRLVVEAARRAIETGSIGPDDPLTVACGLWMMVHGITSLLVAKPFLPWPDTESLVEHCMDTYLRGLTGSAAHQRGSADWQPSAP